MSCLQNAVKLAILILISKPIMFALQEPFTTALTLLYSRLSPAHCLFWSHSNTILTCTPSLTVLSFIECLHVEKELKFAMVNVCIGHEKEQNGGEGMVRSNMIELSLQELEMEKDEVKLAKMELIKSPYSDEEYILCLKSLNHSNQLVSYLFTFIYNIEDIFDGAQIPLVFCEYITERACRVAWVPPFSKEDNSRFVMVGEQALKFVQLQGAKEDQEVITYDFFPNEVKNTDGAFFILHKPFFMTILVSLQQNGTLSFGTFPPSKQSPQYHDHYKTFYSCYHHFDNQQDSFHILQKETAHVRPDATYTGIRIIDIDQFLPGLSIMSLISTAPSGNLTEYRLDLYFLSVTQNDIKMTPIAQISKRSIDTIGEFVSECHGEIIHLRFGKQVWMMELKGLIRLYLDHKGAPSQEEIQGAIKMQKVGKLPESISTLRFIGFCQGHLLMMTLVGSKPTITIKEIGPFPPSKRETDVGLMMLSLRRLLSDQQSMEQQGGQEQFDEIQPVDSVKQGQMTQYLQRIEDLTKDMKKIMSGELTNLFNLYQQSKKMRQAFMLKIAPKMDKLTAIHQRFHQNSDILDELSQKTLQNIQNYPIDDQDGRQAILNEKLRFISECKIEIQGSQLMVLSMTAREQRKRLKQTAQLFSQTIAMLKALAVPDEGPYNP